MSRASEYLQAQYNSRKLKNPRYSMRAFAAHIGIHSGRLSQYFSGERTISFSAARSISMKLGLDSAESEYFLKMIDSDKQVRKSSRRAIVDDELATIVEWYHTALLALLTTKGFQSDYEWISARMQLPVDVVRSSMERLLRLGLVESVNGQFKRRPGPVSTTTDVPSQFLRLSHKDNLRLAAHCLDTLPVEQRDFSSITFAMDMKKMPAAKKMIRDFRIRMANKLSKGTKNEVVFLNIQMFPSTKVGS